VFCRATVLNEVLSFPICDSDYMIRQELAVVIATKRGIALQNAERIVKAIFGAIREGLKRGERVEIRGFGSFWPRQYRAFDGHDPRNGQPIRVAARATVRFKPGQDLAVKTDLNANRVSVLPSRSRAIRAKPAGSSKKDTVD
jgi:nucleoid DNA-binding protein